MEIRLGNMLNDMNQLSKTAITLIITIFALLQLIWNKNMLKTYVVQSESVSSSSRDVEVHDSLSSTLNMP